MPTATVDDKRNGPPLVPPDEKFWQRYSRHHEFPLSGVGSVVLHGLVIGVLALGYMLLTQARQGESHRPVSMDVVQLEGGTGLEGGSGGPATKASPNKEGTEDVHGSQKPDPNNAELPKDNPKLPSIPEPPLILPQGPSAFEIDVTSLKEMAREADRLVQEAMKREADRVATKGSPGDGKNAGGGGAGQGSKSGPGAGSGGMGRKLTRAEVHARRWDFNLFGTPKEHADKLVAAGVILVVPSPRGFLAVRDLKRRPVQLVPQDMERYKDAVYWINNVPGSVAGLADELRLGFRPAFVVMLLPTSREQEIADAEAAYAAARGRDLNSIQQTFFDFRFRGGKFEPIVIDQR